MMEAQLGVFKVRAQNGAAIPGDEGDSLTITLPDGRVVTIYADAASPLLQGGASVLEVYPDQAAYDNADMDAPGYTMVGF